MAILEVPGETPADVSGIFLPFIGCKKGEGSKKNKFEN